MNGVLDEGLSRATLPRFAVYRSACKAGLAAAYGLAEAPPSSWNFGAGYPPSYEAFGRMRNLVDLAELEQVTGGRVLEVAAGDPRLACTLAKRGCDVVVNDLLPEPIPEALVEYGCAGKIRVVAGNMFDLSPEELGRFDVVIAREVIEHVAHPNELLRHLHAFLVPGGRLFLTTPNGMYFRNRLPTLRGVTDPKRLEAEQFRPDADGHLFLLTPDELRGIARAAGLELLRLSVWGTPMVTGHIGLHVFQSPLLVLWSVLVERLTQSLPPPLRARVCSAMAAVLVRRG